MKNLLQTVGNGIRKRITLLPENIVIENIRQFKVEFDSDLWRTSAKTLTATFEGNVDLTNRLVLVEVGAWDMNVRVEPLETDITWYSFGKFYVLRDEFSYNDSTKETTIEGAKDLMVWTHREWDSNDINLSFPTTVKGVVQAICNLVGLELATTNWTRDTHEIEESKWHNNGFTYRDALDDIAEFCHCTISIEQDKVVIKPITKIVVDSIDGFETSLKHEKYWGNVNVLNLSREPQHDNYVYPTNYNEIPLDDRIELVFENNQIIDKRREELAPSLFNSVNGFGYTPFEYTGFGYLTMQFGDYVSFVDDEGVTHYSYITKGSWTVNTGFTEMLGSNLTSSAKEKYALITDQKKLGINTYILVDSQNAEIKLEVSELKEQDNIFSQKISEIDIDLSSIRLEVSQLGGYNIISNPIGRFGLLDWTFESQHIKAYAVAPFNKAYTNAPYLKAQKDNGSIMDGVPTDTQAKYGFRVWKSGKALSQYALVESGSEYSLHTKVKGTGVLTFKLREYNSITPSDKDSFSKETLLNTTIPTTNYSTYEKTVTLDTTTKSVVLVVESDVSSRSGQFALFTNTSFNIGQPKPYGESITDMNNRIDSVNARVTIAEDTVDLFTSKVNTVEGRVNTNTAQLTVQAGEISQKVSTNGVISAINQTAESIKINANRIDLKGYVTVSSLSGEGTTTIDGSNIKTGTISADRINFNGAVGTNVTLSGNISATKFVSQVSDNYYGEIGLADGYVGLGLFDTNTSIKPYFWAKKVTKQPGNVIGFALSSEQNRASLSMHDDFTFVIDSLPTVSLKMGSNGIILNSPTGVYSLRIEDTGIKIYENGIVVASW